jgi:hypothetical protein
VGAELDRDRPFQKAFMVTSEQGADTLVWLSTQPQVAWESGGHYERRIPGQLSKAAKDDTLAEGSWAASATAVLPAG